MSDKLDLILKKLDNHEKLITQQGDMMVQLLQIVGATNNKFSNLEKSVDEIKATQEEHGKILNQHSDDISEIKSDIKNLKETQDQLVTSSENQEYMLEVLSVRSTKQDAEIRKIKNKNAI